MAYDDVTLMGDKIREALAQLPASQLQADALQELAQLERECRRAAALTFVIEKGMVASSQDTKGEA